MKLQCQDNNPSVSVVNSHGSTHTPNHMAIASPIKPQSHRVPNDRSPVASFLASRACLSVSFDSISSSRSFPSPPSGSFQLGQDSPDEVDRIQRTLHQVHVTMAITDER